MYRFIRPLLFAMDPEHSHYLTLKSLKVANALGLLTFIRKIPDYPLEIMGLKFRNPVGISAGLDKNGEYVAALDHLGMGFIELGTVTQRPQPGNSRPRLFRYPEAEAVVNRMGLNNMGVDYLVEKLRHRKFQSIIGVSITQNNHTPFNHAIDEYIFCLQRVYPYADYIAINLSCPNVKLQESLADPENFELLLNALKAEQQTLADQTNRYVPLVMKLSPDLSPELLEAYALALQQFKFDGIIASNTTMQRPCADRYPSLTEKGGLSGAPLFPLSLSVIKQLKTIVGNSIPIIASGGIVSVENAMEMLKAGASLIQLYTGLVYHGFDLAREIVTAIKTK